MEIEDAAIDSTDELITENTTQNIIEHGAAPDLDSSVEKISSQHNRTLLDNLKYLTAYQLAELVGKQIIINRVDRKKSVYRTTSVSGIVNLAIVTSEDNGNIQIVIRFANSAYVDIISSSDMKAHSIEVLN